MKRLFFAAVLIAAAIFICIFSTVSTIKKSAEMKGELEKVAVLITDGKNGEAVKSLDTVQALWNKTESLFSLIIDADKIEEMNIGFSMIRLHLKDKNTEHALERLRECELMLEEIAANERLDIKNIM